MLTQLPPKRRQIVTILLKKSDIALAMAIVSEAKQKDDAITEATENLHEPKGMFMFYTNLVMMLNCFYHK